MGSSPSSRAIPSIRATRPRVVCLAALVLVGAASVAQEPPPPAPPEVKPLGGDRYQVGAILVDKAAGSFTVSGRVLRVDAPLEYIAVTVGGVKNYESLLELDSNAFEFNVACILIGLTTDDVALPRYQFDQEPAVGPRVRITAQWQTGAAPTEADIATLLSREGEATLADDWVYIGSYHDQGATNPYMANELGTLIGFVHDPASVIEHGAGIGIGQYGAIGGNVDLVPPLGTQLTLRVTNAAAAPARD